MKMIIGDLAVDALDKSTITITNPATGEPIDTVPDAGPDDVALAVAKAKAGQKDWAQMPVHQRATILRRFLGLVDEQREALARNLSAETGKPIREARAEIGNIFIGFEAFIEKAKHLYGDVIPNGSEPGQEKTLQLTLREPIGVVACIIPFNFPCDLFDQKVAPALMAGNAAIVKPPHQNPLTLIRLTELMIEAGVRGGAIQVLTGQGAKAGAALTAHPDVHKISFTGSTAVGIETAKNAASHLAHLSLELGGNDAFIVHEDADLDLAVEEMIWGRMYNGGQVCCASKRFLVHNRVRAAFVDKAAARMRTLKVGDPSKEDTQIACLVTEQAARQVEAQVALTLEQGGRLVLGGQRNGAFYAPTLIDAIPKTADVARDLEIFGPVVSVIGFDTLEEAIEIANASKFGLAGCIFSADMKTAMKTAAALECGSVVINGASFYRSFEMPFGGYKYSGLGTEGVLSTFAEVTRLKTVVLKNVLA